MDIHVLAAMKHFVTVTKLHPILVNFTAALVPTSVASDLLAVCLKSRPLQDTGRLTMLYAALITPFTVAAGWLFWMKDDNGDPGMTMHKWLGTSLAVLLIGLMSWRLKFNRQDQKVSGLYLLFGFAFVALLIFQGYLGGTKVFDGM
ncbi:MAG: DUF2231 domain-containing protein [Candidatus Omnitrophica bacterium]|nr:DUF2231 domain-containing protein [Candidatus Omnitrophota bacterium]